MEVISKYLARRGAAAQSPLAVVAVMALALSQVSCGDAPADGATFDQYDAQAEYDRGNHQQAARMWQVLAERGEAEAQLKLGTIYQLGVGVRRDNGEAISWFLRAADQGHPDAMQMLGFHHFAGWGVPQDYVLAHMWYNLSAAHGGSAGPGRDRVAEMMTPQQVADAERLAWEWMIEKSRRP